jgi:hypothetical protein
MMNRTQSLLTIGLAIGALTLAINICSAAPISRWTKISDEDGISSYKREMSNGIIDLLGEGIVDAPIVRVASVFLEYRRFTEWYDSVVEMRIVRRLGPLEFIGYTHLGTPPVIMKDRDFVWRGKIHLDLKKQTLTVSMVPATDPAMPPTHYIRGEMRGYFKLTSVDNGHKTLATVEMHGDPKGSIAKWLVNLFQRNWPRNTLKGMRAQVAKPDLKIIPQVKAAFEGKPFEMATFK